VNQLARSPFLGDLEPAEHAEIEMPAAHQPETVGVVHIARTGDQGHMLPARIDQPRVEVFRARRRPHADDAVLGMQHHLALRRHVIADQRRDADAEIDVPALGMSRATRAASSSRVRGFQFGITISCLS